MNHIFELGTVLLLQRATQAQWLADGRLMSPAQVAAATVGRGVIPDDLQGWFLCGNLHPAMYSLAARAGIEQHWAESHMALSGCTYLLFVQQAQNWQHRFVLPLVGEQIGHFIFELRTQPLRLSLANGNSGEAMVESFGGRGQSMVPDGAVVQAIPDDLPGLAREIRELVVSLLHPDAVVGPALESARHVCVTLVLSDELGATLEAAIVKGTGMRPH